MHTILYSCFTCVQMVSLRAMNCAFTRISHTLLKLNITLHSRHILLYKYKLFNENTKQNQVKVSGNIKVGTTPSYCVMFDIYIHTLSIFGPHRKYVRQETFHSWLSLISYQRIFFALSFLYVEFGKKMLMILYNLVYL